MKNYPQIRKKIYAIVRDTVYSSKKFNREVLDYHILPVVEHSLTLGRKMKADLEILEISALLHDHANIIDYDTSQKDHHIRGAKMAEEMLKNLKVEKETIEKIKNCILSHRASVQLKRKTMEEKILASADAMAHITELASMFCLVYGIHKYQTKEGAKWLKGKLERSWKKIMPEGKEIVREDYEMVMKILNRALENKKTKY